MTVMMTVMAMMEVVASIVAIAEIDPMAMMAPPVNLIDGANLFLCRSDAAWVPRRQSVGRLGNRNANPEHGRSR